MSEDALLPSQRELLEAATLEVLADLARSRETIDEAALCRTLHRVTGIRIRPSDTVVQDLLGRVGLRSWEEQGEVLTALVTAPSETAGATATASFAEVAGAVGLLGEGSDPDAAAAAHRDRIWSRRS